LIIARTTALTSRITVSLTSHWLELLHSPRSRRRMWEWEICHT
jgi:hypothetical protein